MNLRAVDLNLLVVLDALLSEKHVTRAAARLGLSQPAMSSALGRLRVVMRDELLIRTAAGMEPTPRALEMVEPLRQFLRQADRILENASSFDPATTNRCYRIRMSDVLERLILPGLLRRLATEAPNAVLDIVHLPPERTVAALETDDLDLAVSMDLDHASAIRSAVLLADRMVCVLSKDHPAADSEMTLPLFLSLRHLKVSMSPTDGRYVDAALSKMQYVRHVAVNVPHWLVVPDLLENSSMIAVMSARLAEHFAGRRLVVKELPFATSSFCWSLYWHRRHESVPAQRWLREQIQHVGRSLTGGNCAEDSADRSLKLNFN